MRRRSVRCTVRIPSQAREERELRKVCSRRFFGGSVFADLVAHFHKSQSRHRVLEVGGKGF